MAEGFAEIFFGNSTTLGMACVSLARGDLDVLAARVEAEPATLLEIDLASREVRAGDARFPLALPATTRRALLEGAWDPIADLLAGDAAIRATADRLDYLHWTV